MKRITKASLATITMSSALAMLVAGCGTTQNTGASNSSSTPPATSGTPVNGGTITIGQSTKFDDQFIPDMDASLYTANIAAYSFDSLLATDKNLNFIPWLAKSWDWSSDKKTLTIHLQPNANWSDGQPITSDDVLFTINYLASKTYNTTLQGQYEYLVDPIVGSSRIMNGKATSFANTGGFKRIDDKTFSLTFKNVDAAVLWSDISAIQPIPEHILKSIPMKDWGTSSYNKQPNVVSGPYVFSKVTGSDTVQMTANPNYWASKPHIANVVWKTVNPDVAPGLLKDGSIDLLLSGIKPSDVSKLKLIPNVSVVTTPEMGFSYLGLKLYQKEFQNVKVRQAFAYALDRKTMISGILKGYGQPINGPLPSISWAAASTSDGMNNYDYNVAQANKLLDEAGWTKGSDGKRIDPVTGKTANITLDYSSGSPTVEQEALAIKQYLGAVGVQVTLNTPLDFNTLAKKVENDDKNLYMWLMAWSLGTDPDPRGLWDSTDAMNFPRWKDPHNDQLIKATWDAAAFDKNVRKQAFIQWQLYVNKNLPYVFLWEPDNIFAVNKRVHIPTDDWNPYGPFNVQQWWVTQS